MSTPYLRFDKDSPELQALVKWWQGLNKNREDRVKLRRCGSLTEVVLTTAYQRLRRALCQHGTVYDNGLALVAGLTAMVKSNATDNILAEQMATGKNNGSASVSGLRFRRLLKVREQEELFTSMTRIIALLGGTVNLQDLAQSVYFWNDRTRKKWAFSYYSKSPGEV